MYSDLNSLDLATLYAHFEATGLVHRLFELARDEDLGPSGLAGGDVTSAVSIGERETTTASVVMREPGVVAGLAALPLLARMLAPRARLELVSRDGSIIAERNIPMARVSGPTREILAFERPALNLLGRLSGIATLTGGFVQQIRAQGPSRAELFDTRKTTPGLRVLEKYAVRCGGGRCHRIGLYDAVLIKDNHIAGVPVDRLATRVAEASRHARAQARRPDFVEVEVDTLDQLGALLTLPPGVVDIVLLDNMPIEQLREAVRRRDASVARPLLEASGGVRLDTVAAIAQTGVERISCGAITHSAIWVDVALDIDADEMVRPHANQGTRA